MLSPERAHFASADALARAHRVLSWLRYAEPWMHRAFDASFRRLEDGSYRPVLDDAGFLAIYEGVLPRPNPLPLTRITAPVLLVLATFSVMAWPGQVRSVRRQLRDLQIVRVPGEHSLHATNPRGLARALQTFLAEESS
jgi:pimeloyl-ACP methyl ester carboxylesterase